MISVKILSITLAFKTLALLFLVTLGPINPFPTNVPILYALKTSENCRFSDVFRGYRSGTLVKNGLKCLRRIAKKF